MDTDERGWRVAPHGWLVMRASPDPELDGLTERIVGAGFATRLRRSGSTLFRASRFPVGLRMNFGTPRPRWRRVIR
jgi:hypothetical protein